MLWNRVRGLTPWPGTFTWQKAVPKPRLLKVWEVEPLEGAAGMPGEVLQADKQGLVVACGQGALRILSVQREGARRLNAPEFLIGNPVGVGERLGSALPDGPAQSGRA